MAHGGNWKPWRLKMVIVGARSGRMTRACSGRTTRSMELVARYGVPFLEDEFNALGPKAGSTFGTVMMRV